MLVKYEAFVQVPHIVGFWCPHTEWECDCQLFDSITDAMSWMANNRLSYESKADAFISLMVERETVVIWSIFPEARLMGVNRYAAHKLGLLR